MDEVQAAPNGVQPRSGEKPVIIIPVTIDRESSPFLSTQGEEPISKAPSPAEIIHLDATESILRLVVGGVLGVRGILAKQLKEIETYQATENDQGVTTEVVSGDLDQNLARDAMVGLVFKSAESARKGADVALRAAGAVTRIGLAPIKALGRSWPFRPISRGFDSLAERGEKEIKQLAQVGRNESERSLTAVEGTISSVMEEVPQASQINDLVQTMVQNVIAYLQENPDIIQNIVRSQGGIYIEFLHENPEPIQDLVQGQTLSIVGELQEGVREQLVTGDNVIELFARSIFRRIPREELPEPPPEVKARAVRKRIFLAPEKKPKQE